MNRFILPALFSLLFLFTTGCRKNGSSEESRLYGKWVTSALADTLHFYRENGKNLLKQSISFTPSAQRYSVNEYRLNNGKLFFSYPTASGTDFYEMNSFRWVQNRKSFELHGNQRFPFLSSIQPNYIYNRLQ